MKKFIYYYGVVSFIGTLISATCGIVFWRILKKDKEAKELYNEALKVLKETTIDDIKIQKIKK